MAGDDQTSPLARHPACPVWCGGHAAGEPQDVEHYGVVGEVDVPSEPNASDRTSSGTYVVANTQPAGEPMPAGVSVIAPAAEVYLTSSEARALAALLVQAADQIESGHQRPMQVAEPRARSRDLR